MSYSTRKQALKIIFTLINVLSTVNNFVETKAIPEDDVTKVNVAVENKEQIENIDSHKSKPRNLYLPLIITFAALSVCVIFGSVICFKNSKSKQDVIDKSKVITVDLSLPYPSTIPQKKGSSEIQSESSSQTEVINQSMIRLKPVINDRTVSIRRSIIIDKDYSNYCGFSPFPAPGFQFIAIYDYEAQNEDEISLKKNDPILISTNFEDGWTIGKNCTSGQVGFFPITCLGIGPIEDEDNEPTDIELNLFNQMIVPNERVNEE